MELRVKTSLDILDSEHYYNANIVPMASGPTREESEVPAWHVQAAGGRKTTLGPRESQRQRIPAIKAGFHLLGARAKTGLKSVSVRPPRRSNP